ncbi:MAG TPA: MFS transporter [Xanthobacteraceae bacterium]|nr:MFS transporter [Xanthobacteraceae bacterium]
MNFFVADVQTGFGAFVAFYLAQLGWSKADVGLALAAEGIAGVLSQIPGGALADWIKWKRGLAAVGILMIGVAALILALIPSFIAVFCAEILHGLTAGVLTPAIGAISLGLVGRGGMSVRTGRNYRFAAAGNALTAGLMGAAGAYIAKSGIFLLAAALCIPSLIALGAIRGAEIDYVRARNAAAGERAGDILRVRDLAKNRALVLFAAAVVLFQFADASLLPMVGEEMATTAGARASVWMSGLIAAPQIVVALLAPWVGYHSERKGRRPLLLLGFALEPIRAVLLAFTSGYGFLLVVQLLDGVSGAIIGVMTVIVVTDLTAGTGRFNLARGTVGALSGAAAALSTAASGLLFQIFGSTVGFLALAVVAAGATALLWTFINETKPPKYED